MRKKYGLVIVIMLLVLFGTKNRVYAMGNQGIVIEEMTKDEIVLFLDAVKISVLIKEPSKKEIKCFDVNDNGLIAIGTENGEHKTICVYSDSGDFQYGYAFDSFGSFGIVFHEDKLSIIFARSDVAVTVSSGGNVESVVRLCNNAGYDAFWNYYINATSRTIGKRQYYIESGSGILGSVVGVYTRMLMVEDENINRLVYEADPISVLYVWFVFGGSCIFIGIVFVIVIKEVRKTRQSSMSL